MIQRRSLVKHPAFEVGRGSLCSRLIPDAMFLFYQLGGGMMCCFVEMDTGSTNRKQIEAKLWRYEAWSHSTVGQQYLVDIYQRNGELDSKPSFRVLLVGKDRCGGDDAHRLADLCKAAGKMPTDVRKRLWLTTLASLREHQHDLLPLAAAIWRRGLDTRSMDGAKPADGLPVHNLFPAAAEARESRGIDPP